MPYVEQQHNMAHHATSYNTTHKIQQHTQDTTPKITHKPRNPTKSHNIQLHHQVHFGTQHSKMYLLADMIGINCMTGMSCLFRKHVVDAAGGLKALAPYLAEDYYLSQIFYDKWVGCFEKCLFFGGILILSCSFFLLNSLCNF